MVMFRIRLIFVVLYMISQSRILKLSTTMAHKCVIFLNLLLLQLKSKGKLRLKVKNRRRSDPEVVINRKRWKERNLMNRESKKR